MTEVNEPGPHFADSKVTAEGEIQLIAFFCRAHPESDLEAVLRKFRKEQLHAAEQEIRTLREQHLDLQDRLDEIGDHEAVCALYEKTAADLAALRAALVALPRYHITGKYGGNIVTALDDQVPGGWIKADDLDALLKETP